MRHYNASDLCPCQSLQRDNESSEKAKNDGQCLDVWAELEKLPIMGGSKMRRKPQKNKTDDGSHHQDVTRLIRVKPFA